MKDCWVSNDDIYDGFHSQVHISSSYWSKNARTIKLKPHMSQMYLS